jgi:hypothetical protein
MLEKEGHSHSSIAGVHINGGPVLCGVQEDFGYSAILKAADTGRIPNARVFEIE